MSLLDDKEPSANKPVIDTPHRKKNSFTQSTLSKPKAVQFLEENLILDDIKNSQTQMLLMKKTGIFVT